MHFPERTHEGGGVGLLEELFRPAAQPRQPEVGAPAVARVEKDQRRRLANPAQQRAAQVAGTQRVVGQLDHGLVGVLGVELAVRGDVQHLEAARREEVEHLLAQHRRAGKPDHPPRREVVEKGALADDGWQPHIGQDEGGGLHLDAGVGAAPGQPARQSEARRPEVVGVLFGFTHAVVIGLEQLPRNPRLVAGDQKRGDDAGVAQRDDLCEIRLAEGFGQQLFE